jgi:aspartyl-tRNA(Asn)/glutamyl-tRNA(Gln) amidotransferase subunit B
MSWEAVIGLEVHVQLRTATKMFCGCAHRFGAEPNTLVCPVCLGYPGALPVTNPHAVELATRLSLALHCTVRARSIFARKNYFYPDLPKGYQISQYEEPLAEGGWLPLTSASADAVAGDPARRIRIHRLHLEEDAGKLLHDAPGVTRIDFNRCGAPLVEIVSEPDLRSAAEAIDYLQTLRQVLLFTGTSDANMEEGSLRCDANVSVRPIGESRLGTKVEIKNLNSFRFVGRAIEHEIERQVAWIEAGGEVVQETRGYDEASGSTRSQRSKEEAQDYRYFPDPDLEPVVLDAHDIAEVRSSLPELPWERRARYADELGLAPDDAAFLSGDKELGDYFDGVVRATSPAAARAAANWVKGPLVAIAKERGVGVSAAPGAERLAGVLALLDANELSSGTAKDVFAALWDDQAEPRVVAARLGLLQVSDRRAIEEWVNAVVDAHPTVADEWRAGKAQAIGFLVGQVMKRSAGRADPKVVQEILRTRLAAASVAPGA